MVSSFDEHQKSWIVIMLKSTYKITPPSELPSGWTEHKAPTGHTYYYNAVTKQSTYTRPSHPGYAQVPLSLIGTTENFLQEQTYPQISSYPKTLTRDKIFKVRNDYNANEQTSNKFRAPKPQPLDKPKSCQTIPGFENWKLIHTKFNRRFVYNIEKDQSFWRIPEKLKSGILILDQTRIKEKAEALNQDNGHESKDSFQGSTNSFPAFGLGGCDADASSDNEEVEVTDDELEQDITVKSHAVANQNSEKPVEFTEDDIAFQLAVMGEEYGLEPDEYGGEVDHENHGYNVDQESVTLFKDMLDEFNVNPYSPWDKIINEGILIDDIRYTALPNMKMRKKVWDEWSRDKIQFLRETRANQEKKDPRSLYTQFLLKHATPKLYWLEFKRKYRKENEMRDPGLTDKDREKMYREYINRLKLSQTT